MTLQSATSQSTDAVHCAPAASVVLQASHGRRKARDKKYDRVHLRRTVSLHRRRSSRWLWEMHQPRAVELTIARVTFFSMFLWPPCVIGQAIIFWPVVSSFFFFLFFFIFFSPNLSGRRLDVYHTSTHGVALVRIYNGCLKRAAHSSLEMQDPKIAISAPSHNFVGLYLRN